MMNTKKILNAGTATAAIFWASTFVAGYLHGNYNHINDTISELGALGTRSHAFMTAATCLGAVSGLIFFAGMIKACRELHINIIPALTIISIPFTFAWVAYFPSGTDLHPAGGMGMFLLYIGVILSLFLWKGKGLRTVSIWSFISLILLLLIFLRFTPFIVGHEGLIQRFAHLGWSVWFVSLNVCFVQLLNRKTPIHKN